MKQAFEPNAVVCAPTCAQHAIRLPSDSAATVAALENIRLDLLRLQLGDGHVDSVTASLDAAREVGVRPRRVRRRN